MVLVLSTGLNKVSDQYLCVVLRQDGLVPAKWRRIGTANKDDADVVQVPFDVGWQQAWTSSLALLKHTQQSTYVRLRLLYYHDCLWA